nr:MAG TPA: tail tape measure protein [Caudoviricetes sp.]
MAKVERDISVKVTLLGADKFKTGMKSVSGSMGLLNNWVETTKGNLASKAIEQTLEKIKELFVDSFNNAIEFDDALAGIAKTTNMSEVKLKQMGNQLMDLSESIPMTAVELAGLAESAGQLGIAENDILDFVEVVAAMGVSTNISAEEAATAFARIANIFGTSAKDYDNLGSVVVDLGNKFATTEAEIVSMAYNMAGMGATVGMTEEDIFAFAAALSSLGIEAEAGGTSMQKLFQIFENAAMRGDKIEGLAQVMGVTTAEFIRMWEQDPATAILKFIGGLSEIDEAGGSAAVTLQEVGIKEVRLQRSVLGLAQGYDTLERSINTADAAWEDGNALAEEANKRYGTLGSRLEMTKNAVENTKTALGTIFAGTAVNVIENLGDAATSVRKTIMDVDVPKAIQEAMDAMDQDTKGIEDTINIANNIVDAMEAMGDVDQLDDAGLAEYNANLNVLKGLVPGITTLIDEETGAVKGGTTALREQIAASKELDIIEAQYEQWRNAADAYAIGVENLTKKQEELVWLKAQEAQLQKDLEEYAALKDVPGANYQNSEYERMNMQLVHTTANRNQLEQEIAADKAMLAEYQYVIDGFTNSAEEYAAAGAIVVDGADAMSTGLRAAQGQLEELGTRLDEYRNQYNEAYVEILGNLASQYGGFTYVNPIEIDEEAPSLVDSLQSQIDFFREYQALLETVQGMGYNEDIVSHYLDGSEKSAEMLTRLAEASPEEVAQINAAYTEAAQAREKLAADLAEAQTDFTANVQTIVDQANEIVAGTDVSNEMYTNGVNNIQKLIDGLNAKIGTLRTTVGAVNSIMNSAGSVSGVSVKHGSKYNPKGMNAVPHAAGLAYVPFDGYLAELHRGEMVLTALEAKAYRAEKFATDAMLRRTEGSTTNIVRQGGNTTNNMHVEFGGVTVKDEADVGKIARGITKLNHKNARGVGAR